MTAADLPFLALGLGNELLSDEGVGVVAARRLEDRNLPEVEVLDGGTLGLGLLPALEGREGVVVFDAVTNAGARPGSVLAIERDELPAAQRLFASAHDLGLLHTLDAADLYGTAPRRLVVLGVVPRSMELGYGLTTTVAARVDELVERAAHLLTSWRLEREVLRA